MPVVLNTDAGSDTAIVEQVEDTSTPATPAEQYTHQARLYGDETVYPLRFPVGRDTATLNLGNTAQPVLPRKKGGLPNWNNKPESGVQWGRQESPSWG